MSKGDTMSIAQYIDHTLLKPEAREEQIVELCQEAIEYGFASVCINPQWVTVAKEALGESNCAVCTVVGFPLGATTTNTKSAEAHEAVEHGASEIDMVIAVGKLKDGDYDYVRNDIRAVVNAAHPALVKVIIEACLLTDEEKYMAVSLIKEAGAHFVKTSTGFSMGGATGEDVQTLSLASNRDLKVKASGGIRTYDQAHEMLVKGAERLGVSQSIAIVKEEKERGL